MEPLPQKPILIPQSRRYTREFKSDGSKTYKSTDQICIQIPPISNTYMTKENSIHFKSNMSFQEASVQNYEFIAQQLYALGKDYGNDIVVNGEAEEYIAPGWVAGVQNLLDFFDVSGVTLTYGTPPTQHVHNANPQGVFYGSWELKKTLPTLATCGPYGFFSEIQVYDYLGTTLLETIKGHDVWSAFMADFNDFDPNLNSLRPTITTLNAFNVPFETRFPAINYLDTSNQYQNFDTLLRTFNNVVVNIPTVEPTGPVQFIQNVLISETAPRYWRIDLLGFMGKASQKFAPVHNGFTIKLIVNDPRKAIVMANGVGDDFIFIDAPAVLNPSDYPYGPQKWLCQGSVTDFFVSDCYLKTELLEVSSEIDSRIDKVLHVKMRDYIQHPSSDIEFNIPFQKRSLTKLIVFERFVDTYGDILTRSPLSYRTRYPGDSHEKLGYRVNNHVETAVLKYNDARVVSYRLPEIEESIFRYMGDDFNKIYMDQQSFFGELSNIDYIKGTRGLQTLFMPYQTMMDRIFRPGTNFNNLYYEYITEYNKIGNQNMGKFAMVFDLELPGFTNNNVCGIDTTKSWLTMHIERDQKYFDPKLTNLDLFGEYDAFIHVDPGKTTSVSF